MISIQITSLFNGASVVIRGNEEQVEKQLRAKFNGFTRGVPQGDVYSILKAMSRSVTFSIKVLEGENEIERKPHLNPIGRHAAKDPWEREVDNKKDMKPSDIPDDPENFD